MSVTVTLPTILRQHTDGARVVQAAGDNLGQVLADLTASYPGLVDHLGPSETGLPRYVNVFVDGEEARYLGGLEAPVSDGSEITILPAVAGGGR